MTTSTNTKLKMIRDNIVGKIRDRDDVLCELKQKDQETHENLDRMQSEIGETTMKISEYTKLNQNLINDREVLEKESEIAEKRGLDFQKVTEILEHLVYCNSHLLKKDCSS